eukprot:260883-Amphidinium_carterae.2
MDGLAMTAAQGCLSTRMYTRFLLSHYALSVKHCNLANHEGCASDTASALDFKPRQPKDP